MNSFEKHGIAKLSPSSLNAFIASPGIWAVKYLANIRDPGAPKMWRGIAVETGFIALCQLGDLQKALDAAYVRYAFLATEAGYSEDDLETENKQIAPMLKQCQAWYSVQPQSQHISTQIEVECWLDGVSVPIRGFVDAVFDDRDVDLKTVGRKSNGHAGALPNKPRGPDVRQVSLYRHARNNKPGGLLYVSDTRHAYFEVDDVMKDAAIAELSEAARKLEKLLGAFDDPQDLLDALPIDYDDFRSPKERLTEVRASRRPASSQFTAVETGN